MMSETITVDLGEVARSNCIMEVAIKLKGRRRFIFRIWLAGRLMALGARIFPVPAEISTDWLDE